jgi:hypothetical protein
LRLVIIAPLDILARARCKILDDVYEAILDLPSSPLSLTF